MNSATYYSLVCGGVTVTCCLDMIEAFAPLCPRRG